MSLQPAGERTTEEVKNWTATYWMRCQNWRGNTDVINTVQLKLLTADHTSYVATAAGQNCTESGMKRNQPRDLDPRLQARHQLLNHILYAPYLAGINPIPGLNSCQPKCYRFHKRYYVTQLTEYQVSLRTILAADSKNIPSRHTT